MKRRGFIKRLFGVATAAVVSEKLIPDDGVSLFSARHPALLHDAAHHDLTGGFGLAPAKAEGSVMLYDDLDAPLAPLSDGVLEELEIDIRTGHGVMTRAEFSEQLADGLNKAFKEAYADYEPDGWPKPG